MKEFSVKIKWNYICSILQFKGSKMIHLQIIGMLLGDNSFYDIKKYIVIR